MGSQVATLQYLDLGTTSSQSGGEFPLRELLGQLIEPRCTLHTTKDSDDSQKDRWNVARKAEMFPRFSKLYATVREQQHSLFTIIRPSFHQTGSSGDTR